MSILHLKAHVFLVVLTRRLIYLKDEEVARRQFAEQMRFCKLMVLADNVMLEKEGLINTHAQPLFSVDT